MQGTHRGKVVGRKDRSRPCFTDERLHSAGTSFFRELAGNDEALVCQAMGRHRSLVTGPAGGRSCSLPSVDVRYATVAQAGEVINRELRTDAVVVGHRV